MFENSIEENLILFDSSNYEIIYEHNFNGNSVLSSIFSQDSSYFTCFSKNIYIFDLVNLKILKILKLDPYLDFAHWGKYFNYANLKSTYMLKEDEFLLDPSYQFDSEGKYFIICSNRYRISDQIPSKHKFLSFWSAC